ncbi:MAG: CAP domain-containing protein [Solirubrobacterales bacterium]
MSTASSLAREPACSGQHIELGKSSSAPKAEKALLCLLNREREKRGVPRLTRHYRLDGPARDHSKVMVEKGCFAHTCEGESSLGDRLADYLAQGGQGYGENIANGIAEAGTPWSVVRSWMKNKGNRRNVLDRDYEHAGIGVVEGTPNEPAMGATYTADFGYRGQKRPMSARKASA